jgi:hypothetical protein
MIIFFALISVAVISIHCLVMRAVKNYEYGGGSFREWQEFERQYGYRN